MTSLVPVQCRACAHLRTAMTCRAYPDRIPDEIVLRGADHRDPREGDGGVRFQLADGPAAQQALRDWEQTFGRK